MIGKIVYYRSRTIRSPRPALVIHDHGNQVLNLAVWMPDRAQPFYAHRIGPEPEGPIKQFWTDHGGENRDAR